MTEVEQFCRKHAARAEGADWASQYATLADVYDNCERGDWLIWMLVRGGKIDKRQAVEIAIKCAMRALKHYEEKHPDDKRPRKALEAARAWLRNPNDETRAAAAAAAAYDVHKTERLKEQKAQCKIIRKVVINPWR